MDPMESTCNTSCSEARRQVIQLGTAEDEKGNRKKRRDGDEYVGVSCQVSGVRCQVSGVRKDKYRN